MRSCFPNGAAVAFMCALATASCGDNLPGAHDAPDNGVRIPGLQGPATAYLDSNGILHIQCSTDADCHAVQGYFQAADRFFQMDLRRRLARGRLSEIVGGVALDTDRRWRRLMTSRDGTPMEEVVRNNLDARALEALTAYTRGVNAWLADVRAGRNEAVLSDEYDFFLIEKDKALATDWEVLDSTGCAMPLVQALTDSSGWELLLAELHTLLPADVVNDLFPQRPVTDSSILTPNPGTRFNTRVTSPKQAGAPVALARRMREAAGVLDRADAQVPPTLRRDRSIGSNNWVVGPGLAGDGTTLLANDTHLPLSHPAIWHVVHLDAKSAGQGTLQVAGVSFPGFPGIFAGQNGNIAWGLTANAFDHTDVYLERLNPARDAVFFEGREVPITTVNYTLAVAGGSDVPFAVKVVPHHGPIIQEDGERAVSVRWTGHDVSTDANAMLELAVAGSVSEAKAAISKVTTLGQNFVVSDRHGNWGWFPFGRLPKRPWASSTLPPWLPLPGDGSAEWQGYFSLDELPQAENAGDFLATANNGMTPAWADGNPFNDDNVPFQVLVDAGFRHGRIAAQLRALGADGISEAEMTQLQGDVYSLLGSRVTPILLADSTAIAAGSPAAGVRSALAAWDFTCPTGLATSDPEGAAHADASQRAASVGCAAFHIVMGQLRKLAFADDVAAFGGAATDEGLALALLRPGALSTAYWNDTRTKAIETRPQLVVMAMEAAGQFLAGRFGLDASAWLWGRLHTLTLRADLFDQAGFPEYNASVVARDGGPHQVNVGGTSDDTNHRYDMRHGAAMRLVCKGTSDAMRCSIQLPGGQPHHRQAAAFNALLPRWLENRPVPLHLDFAAISASSAQQIRIAPGS